MTARTTEYKVKVLDNEMWDKALNAMDSVQERGSFAFELVWKLTVLKPVNLNSLWKGQKSSWWTYGFLVKQVPSHAVT